MANSFFRTMRTGVVRAAQAKDKVIQQVTNVARNVGLPGVSVLSTNPRQRNAAGIGMQALFGNKSRATGLSSFEELVSKNPHKAKELNKLSRLAISYGNKVMKGRGAGAVNTLQKMTKLVKDTGIDLSGIKPKFSTTLKNVASGAHLGSSKVYSNALLNPRTIATGAGLFGATQGVNYVMNRDKAWRTENVGSGKFGKDTRGLLGNAGLEGLKFQTYKRRGRFG